MQARAAVRQRARRHSSSNQNFRKIVIYRERSRNIAQYRAPSRHMSWGGPSGRPQRGRGGGGVSAI